MAKSKERVEHSEVIFDDYPVGKYARKVDWWLSDAGLEAISGWRQCGCTIREIVARMGVDPRTFNAWRRKCPKLDEILTLGQEVTNGRVVDALYKRATGFHYDEITRELVDGQLMVTKVVTKYVPPDVKASLAWLFNRYGEAWRAVQPPLDLDAQAIGQAGEILATIRETAMGYSQLGEPGSMAGVADDSHGGA